MTISAAQREERRNGIGSSDCAAIVLGADDFQTALDVYVSKIYPTPDATDDTRETGNILEEPIRRIAALKLGMAVTEAKETFRHPKHPWMLANLDGIAADEGIIEAKAIDWRKAKALGDAGSDFCLPSHHLQVQHQLEVTGRPWAYVCYFVSAFDFRIFTVPRDEEIGAAIVAKESAFWHDNVLARVPPESDDAEARMRYLAMEHRGDAKADVLTVTAGTSAGDAVLALRDARAARIAAEKSEKACIARVQALMGASTRLECPWGSVGWSAAKKSGRRFTPKFTSDASDDAQE